MLALRRLFFFVAAESRDPLKSTTNRIGFKESQSKAKREKAGRSRPAQKDGRSPSRLRVNVQRPYESKGN